VRSTLARCSYGHGRRGVRVVAKVELVSLEAREPTVDEVAPPWQPARREVVVEGLCVKCAAHTITVGFAGRWESVWVRTQHCLLRRSDQRGGAGEGCNRLCPSN
jgi:hypothetical protein